MWVVMANANYADMSLGAQFKSGILIRPFTDPDHRSLRVPYSIHDERTVEEPEQGEPGDEDELHDARDLTGVGGKIIPSVISPVGHLFQTEFEGHVEEDDQISGLKPFGQIELGVGPVENPCLLIEDVLILGEELLPAASGPIIMPVKIIEMSDGDAHFLTDLFGEITLATPKIPHDANSFHRHNMPLSRYIRFPSIIVIIIHVFSHNGIASDQIRLDIKDYEVCAMLPAHPPTYGCG